MKRLDRMPTYIHMTMAFMGGLWGAYSVVQWTNLGNAHTTNLIKIVLRLIDGDWLEFALCVGSASCTFWHLHFQHIGANTARAIALCGYHCWGGIVGCSLFLSTKLACIYTSVSLCVLQQRFSGPYFVVRRASNCATIFNSNNYRQFSSSFAEVYLNKDPSFRPKMKFFGCTLLFYHFGVVYVYLILKAVLVLTQPGLVCCLWWWRRWWSTCIARNLLWQK